MTVGEARTIMDRFYEKGGRETEEEFFLYTEAAHFLIEETDDVRIIHELGGEYESKKLYDLAYKYFSLAAMRGYLPAYESLGYIWYYGRLGSAPDYRQAYECFTKADSTNSRIKIADMYLRGYYVEKDPEKAKEILEELYRTRLGRNLWNDAGICVRLAEIREKEGDCGEAVRLLQKAKQDMAVLISRNSFFGSFSVMRNLIRNLYRLIPLDTAHLDLFDLYEVLSRPAKVQFSVYGKICTAESVAEPDNTVSVCLEGTWFRNVEEMMMHAEIGGEALSAMPWAIRKITVCETG